MNESGKNATHAPFQSSTNSRSKYACCIDEHTSVIFQSFNCEIMREMDGFAMLKYAIDC